MTCAESTLSSLAYRGCVASAQRRRPTVASVLGELLMTAGALLLLLCGYQVWWSNVDARAVEDQRRVSIDAAFESPATAAPGSVPTDAPGAPAHSGASPTSAAAPRPGEGFAYLYIPRLRDSVWRAPIVQGVTLAELRGAIGHYPQTQLPGEVGNFALAGHRATNGELLRDFDRLRRGDRVYVQTSTAWFTYQLSHDAIVDPSRVGVLLPVPDRPGVAATRPVITLTTCTPRWASTERWVWWGDLVGVTPRDAGAPAEVGG